MNLNVRESAPSRDDAPSVAGEFHSVAKLRHSSIRGGIAKLASQLANVAIRLLFIAILSRLIHPADFGLFTMAVVLVGLFQAIAGGGIASGAIQNKELTESQLYFLFVFTVLLSLLVSLGSYVLSLFAAQFYHDPRISSLVLALIPSFVLTSIGSVPVALLQRQMRFGAVATLDVVSGLASSALGIALAFMGYGYWALVASAVAWPAVNSIGAWVVSGWVPRPSRDASGVRPLIHMGGTVVVNTIVVYLAYNLEKMLLGRYWGADALGLYGRASQLSTLPATQLSQSIGPVAFAALSKLQDQPDGLRRYFFDFFYLMNCATVPTSFLFLFFAPEIVGTILGPEWAGASDAFRLLAPSVLILGMMNPPGWLLFALGLQRRSLAIAVVIAMLCIGAYLLGLPYGPNGVSAAYSTVLALWLIPHLSWCFHGTPIRLGHIFRAVGPSLVAGLTSATMAFAALSTFATDSGPVVRLMLACGLMGPLHLFILLVVLGQRRRFVELYSDIRLNYEAVT